MKETQPYGVPQQRAGEKGRRVLNLAYASSNELSYSIINPFAGGSNTFG